MKKEIIYLLLVLFTMISCNNVKKIETEQDKSARKLSVQDSLTAEQISKEFTPEGHYEAMEQVFGKPRYNIKTIGILVYDGVNSLDVMGPRYVLGQAMGVKTMLIGVKKGSIKTVKKIELVPDTTIDQVEQLDILVIPGGFKGTIEATYDEKLHQWIRKMDENTTYTAGVCTGVWILGATGLLKDKKATVNWYRANEMLHKYGATFTNDRFTQDGKYWTSAGVTAGIDMALAIMNDIYGEAYTQAIMLDMEYNPNPPIQGGSIEKTKPIVLQMMKTMYDSGFLPIVDSLETQKRNRKY
ncbi:DJ-1/PfpI family protein [Aquimarina celericrescens]|uniref:DJ-1/PfpI family protein n=1 Tax=Aquimarina celericrescens TaxID=1964542 RepID=A0ABW5AWE0_9FLAO